jgi:hypothetical protein
VWSSNAATATVTAAANGLTAEVTITGEGTAIITADVDGVTATYTISTESVFETAVGYWTFDDAADLGKATRGDIGLEISDVVTAVDGPVTGNGAVRGTFEERDLEGDNTVNITWNHQMAGQVEDKIRNFTMLLDVKTIYQDPAGILRQVWAPVYWNGTDAQAGLFLLWVDYGTSFGLAANLTGGYDYLIPDGTYTSATISGNEPWIRFVFSVEPDVEDPEKVIVKYYLNGQEAPTPSASWSAWGINEIIQGSPVHFMTKRKPDKQFKGQYDLSTLAVWDHVLTPEEISSLGSVSK